MRKAPDEILFKTKTQISDEDLDDEEIDDIDDIDICPICRDPLTKEKLTINLPCKHSCHYNCVMGVRNHTCPICRHPIPKSLSRKAILEGNLSDFVKESKWLYKAKTQNKWWYFEEDIGKELEEEYQKYTKDKTHHEIKIVIRGYQYTINFNTMTQSSEIGNTRDIKRKTSDDNLEILGVGGITVT